MDLQTGRLIADSVVNDYERRLKTILRASELTGTSPHTQNYLNGTRVFLTRFLCNNGQLDQSNEQEVQFHLCTLLYILIKLWDDIPIHMDDFVYIVEHHSSLTGFSDSIRRMEGELLTYLKWCTHITPAQLEAAAAVTVA